MSSCGLKANLVERRFAARLFWVEFSSRSLLDYKMGNPQGCFFWGGLENSVG
jgi:hypothetical protein